MLQQSWLTFSASTATSLQIFWISSPPGEARLCKFNLLMREHVCCVTASYELVVATTTHKTISLTLLSVLLIRWGASYLMEKFLVYFDAK